MQFRKDSHTYLEQEKTIFETVMIADQNGNRLALILLSSMISLQQVSQVVEI